MLKFLAAVLAIFVSAFVLVSVAHRRNGGTLLGGLKRTLEFAKWSMTMWQNIVQVCAKANAELNQCELVS